MKFQYIKDKVSAYFTKGNERSVAVKKNIAVSLVLKCISILVSLQVVPLTIGYVNPTKYGIWLTLLPGCLILIWGLPTDFVIVLLRQKQKGI